MAEKYSPLLAIMLEASLRCPDPDHVPIEVITDLLRKHLQTIAGKITLDKEVFEQKGIEKVQSEAVFFLVQYLMENGYVDVVVEHMDEDCPPKVEITYSLSAWQKLQPKGVEK